MLKRVLLVALTICLIVSTCACAGNTPSSESAAPGPSEPADSKPAESGVPKADLRLGTTGVTGVYYLVGNAFSQTMAKFCPSIKLTPEVTDGSVANLQMLEAGEIDLGMAIGFTILEADKGGTKAFPNPVPLYSLTAFNTGSCQFVVRVGSGIESVKDLVGKKVCTGTPGSVMEILPLAIFKVAGIDPEKDLSWQRIGFQDGMDALNDGRIDAVMYTAGYPVTSITESTTTTGKAKVISIDDELIDKVIAEVIPSAVKCEIPAGIYKNDKPIYSVGAANLVVSSQELPDDVAYYIVKTLFENIDSWKDSNISVNHMNLEEAIKGSPIDFHPGAIKYYKEAGVWKD